MCEGVYRGGCNYGVCVAGWDGGVEGCVRVCIEVGVTMRCVGQGGMVGWRGACESMYGGGCNCEGVSDVSDVRCFMMP